MSITSDYQEILQRVAAWPAERKVSLANEILGSVQGQAKPKAKRDTLSRALGLARGNGPPPDDTEVDRILEEHRMEKYGR
jgi:hypothetical protein